MVSNGHSEFRYIALHLAVVASAELRPAQRPALGGTGGGIEAGAARVEAAME